MRRDGTERYRAMFERLQRAGQGAFVPFCVLGDPDPAASGQIVETLVRAGADALELGIAFSDPVADGPVIQRADLRALAAGARPGQVWASVSQVRGAFPDVPIGLLVYANLVETHGRQAFYGAAREAGADSVLVADVPTAEAAPFCQDAQAAGVAPVLIATSNCSGAHLDTIASLSRGYTYVVTRAGVTGDGEAAQGGQGALIGELAKRGAPPCLLGFGISAPEHVRAALLSGAHGAISGSAVVRRIEEHLGDRAAMHESLRAFVAEMKAATGG